MPEIVLAEGYTPGALGRIASLHGAYYAEHWGFDLFFEAKVATELSEFLSRFDDTRDGLWTVSVDGQIEGAICLDGQRAHAEGAHLRWFIVSDALRGQGAGRQLITAAATFCRDHGYPKAYLWTFEGLDAAKHLYEAHGFLLVEEHLGDQWGTPVNEQRFECEFSANA